LLEIIPANQHSNDMLLDTVSIPRQYWNTLGLNNGGELNIAREDEKILAIIVPGIAADGYSGDIKLITGIYMDGTVAGVRVLSHSETPGLGDKIELRKSSWINSFKGTSLNDPKPARWSVKKDGGDFDQFTGATITPRAVVTHVKRALDYFAADHQRITRLNEREKLQPGPLNTATNKPETNKPTKQ
jgi:electron transport complex protein RnfG